MSWQARGEPWEKRMAWLVDTCAGGSQKKFADRVGVAEESVRKWSLDETRPSMEKLVAILTAYPAVNPEWLIVGTGPPERDPSGTPERDVARDVLAELRATYDALALRYGPPPTSESEDDDDPVIPPAAGPLAGEAGGDPDLEETGTE